MIKDNRTIIEITNTHIKLLQVKQQRGKPMLSRLDIFEIKGRNEQQLADLLMRTPIKSKNTIVVLPKRNVILKKFVLPSHNDEEIKKMLSLKVLQQIPFSQEEIVFDHFMMEKTQDGYTKVLTAISPLDQLSPCLRIVEKAGLELSHVFISSFGIVGWFSQLVPHERKPVGILNLDYDATELCFCLDGKFIFSRNFNFGLNDLTENNIPDILHQIELTLKACKNDFPQYNVEKILLVTDIFQIETLKSSIAEHFHVTVETVRPSEKIPCELQVLSLMKNFPMVSIISSWGFVLSDIDKQIDLKPQSMPKMEKAPLAFREFIPFFASFIAFIVMIIAALNMPAYEHYLNMKQMEKNFSPVQDKAFEEKQKMEDIRKIRSIHLRPPMADILRDIYQKIPKGITLSQIWITQDFSLNIEGISADSKLIYEFQKGLQNVKRLSNVNIQSAVSKKYGSRDLLEFKIKGLVSSTEDLKDQ